MKGLPMTYNRDMQEDKEPLFDAADQLCGSLEMARVVVESAKLNPARPAAGGRGKLGGRDGSGRGAGARGHAVSSARIRSPGKLVLESVRAGKKPARLDRGGARRFRAGVHGRNGRAAEPAEGMKTREIPGGTGPRAVAAALARRADACLR